MTFAGRRSGQHFGRLSLLALVVALIVAAIGGIDAFAERMLVAGSTRILDDAEPQARTIRVVAVEAADSGSQDEEVRAAITDAFSDSDVEVSRHRAAEAAIVTATATATATEPSVLRLIEDARLPERATLTGGSWPRSRIEIALPDAAAARLHLGIGDTVTLSRDGTTVVLAGTWTADDPEDPAWYGDPAVVSGESDGRIGPAIVAAGALAELPGATTVTWEISPTRAGPADLPSLQRALESLDGLPDAIDPQRRHNTRILGNLGETLQRQGAAVTATRGLLLAPILVVALVGSLVLGLLLSALSTARREELALLRARGASVRRLLSGAAAEAAGLAAAGASVALVFLAIIVGLAPAALLAGAAATALAAGVAALLVARSARRADAMVPENLRSDAGRRTLPVLLLPAGIAAGPAILSAWQLFSTSAVVRPDGTPEPLAAAAPALLLIAACGIVPLAAGPLAALVERLLRRTRGIAPMLPLRQVSRRMGNSAVVILCLALASASVVLASVAPSAAGAAEQRTRDAVLGADVRMISERGAGDIAEAAATWKGVTSVVSVLRTPVSVGSDTAVLVAGPPEALDFAVRLPSDPGDSIVAAITGSLASRLGAQEGTVFTARIRSVARPVSFEVVRIVDAIPGIGGGLGIAADPQELQAASANRDANELWLRSSTPQDTATRLRSHATDPVRILTAAQVSNAPVTSATPALLTAGALVSAVLGVVGFLAASSATARVRRGETFVLRALGLSSSAQRALRAGETLSVAAYAVVAGAGLGAIVAAAVLPIVLGTLT